MFNKGKQTAAQKLLGDVLDCCDADVLVVGGKDCKILFANTSMQNNFHARATAEGTCKVSFSRNFPSICDHCPHLRGEAPEQPIIFEIKNNQKRRYSVRMSHVEWFDQPATVISLRDVEEEHMVKEKLYNLAYIDQLTGAPNRQKFREDFDAVAGQIGNGNMCGVVALFDLDNFKAINDTYGHNTGDIMLRRIAEHLMADAAFAGHLYRLGGDEFVLFYHEPANTYASPEALAAHYEKVLGAAFLSYSMPNIEKACTISMGITQFPIHGATSSELLRKADIALYKAKAAGRNIFVAFEDQYDTAQKFKDLYINIEPILNKTGRTIGYELMDKGDKKEEKDTINLAEVDRALDALGLGDIENDACYFISFSRQLLNPAVLNNLPKDKFIIQWYAQDEVTQSEMALIRKLRSLGYKFALDGLTPRNASPELLALAEYGKFQDPDFMNFMQKKIIADNPKNTFIATHINTQEAHEAAQKQGFKLFQGYFFNQPVVTKKTKEIDPIKANYFRLLKLSSQDGYVDFKEISNIISADVALSYKLLKLLNSAAVGLRSKISSISMAVAYLGENSLKKWIALLALRGMATDKPLELVRFSLIRAQFGELLAPHLRPKRDPKNVFLLGMLSLLHIALEKSKEELFDEIPVAEEIRESLLSPGGMYSDLVKFFSDYEYGNWEEVSLFARENNISGEVINDAYIASVKWYNDLASE